MTDLVNFLVPTADVGGAVWSLLDRLIEGDPGTVQAIHYFITKPESQVVADMGHFLTTRQWFTDKRDPFHRAPSFMTYDREANEVVTQDGRAWIPGLGDEGGVVNRLCTSPGAVGHRTGKKMKRPVGGCAGRAEADGADTDGPPGLLDRPCPIPSGKTT